VETEKPNFYANGEIISENLTSYPPLTLLSWVRVHYKYPDYSVYTTTNDMFQSYQSGIYGSGIYHSFAMVSFIL